MVLIGWQRILRGLPDFVRLLDHDCHFRVQTIQHGLQVRKDRRSVCLDRLPNRWYDSATNSYNVNIRRGFDGIVTYAPQS